jgi:hypothetical protein
MPLRIDGQYRGPHAVHVRSHRKLGRHKTVISDAYPVVSALISDPLVSCVDFGKVMGGNFTPRLEISAKGSVAVVYFVGRAVAQQVTIVARNESYLPELVKHINDLWSNRAQS